MPRLPLGSIPRSVWLLALAYTVVYSILCAIRFRYDLYTSFDLAIFAQSVDGILRGTLFTSIRGMHWLGDHSSLILFLVAPIYAVARHPMTLLVLQSAVLGAGAIPVYVLARREIGHPQLAVTCAVLYLLNPAMGYANLFEFHPEMLATPMLIAAFYYVRAGRSWPTAAWSAAALLCREDVALVVLMLALYALLRPGPQRWRMALALAVLAVASIGVTWGLLRPAFSQGEAEYAGIYRGWGNTLWDAFLGMVREPLEAVVSLFTTPDNPRDSMIKAQYYFTMLGPLGFLPLLSPMTLVISLPILAEHMLSWRTAQHTILCQYTALILPFTAAATVLGMRNLLRLVDRRPRAGNAGAAHGKRKKSKSRPKTEPRDEAAAAPPGATTAPPPGAGAPIRAVRLLMVWALGTAVVASIWYGPLLSNGTFLLTPTLGRHWPTGIERAATRHRDRLIERVPDQGAVVASFDWLNRFTNRDSVHSLHHVVRGTYTFSTNPYPRPLGVAAMVADLSAPGSVAHVGPESASRLQDVLAVNRLVPAEVVGDLVLFLRDAPDPITLIAPGVCDAPLADPLVFDGQLAFLGGQLVEHSAKAGETLELCTSWGRQGQIDRLLAMEVALVDASGLDVYAHVHDIGYLVYPPHTWSGFAMRETYRLLLPDDLAAGEYRVLLRVRWRSGGAPQPSVPNDPERYGNGFDLGRVRVIAR